MTLVHCCICNIAVLEKQALSHMKMQYNLQVARAKGTDAQRRGDKASSSYNSLKQQHAEAQSQAEESAATATAEISSLQVSLQCTFGLSIDVYALERLPRYSSLVSSSSCPNAALCMKNTHSFSLLLCFHSVLPPCLCPFRHETCCATAAEL